MFSKIVAGAVIATVSATWTENHSCVYDWETELVMDTTYITDRQQCLDWCKDPARGQWGETFEVGEDMCCDVWEWTDENSEVWYSCYLNIGSEMVDESVYDEADMTYAAHVFQFTELDDFNPDNAMDWDDWAEEPWFDDFEMWADEDYCNLEDAIEDLCAIRLFGTYFFCWV